MRSWRSAGSTASRLARSSNSGPHSPPACLQLALQGPPSSPGAVEVVVQGRNGSGKRTKAFGTRWTSGDLGERARGGLFHRPFDSTAPPSALNTGRRFDEAGRGRWTQPGVGDHQPHSAVRSRPHSHSRRSRRDQELQDSIVAQLSPAEALALAGPPGNLD
jgi:hypothetical protein